MVGLGLSVVLGIFVQVIHYGGEILSDALRLIHSVEARTSCTSFEQRSQRTFRFVRRVSLDGDEDDSNDSGHARTTLNTSTITNSTSAATSVLSANPSFSTASADSSTQQSSSSTGNQTDTDCSSDLSIFCPLQFSNCTSISNANAEAEYSAGWALLSENECIYHTTNIVSSTMTLSFTGSGIVAVGLVPSSNDTNLTLASYIIDGGDPITPVLPSANSTLKQPLFTSPSLSTKRSHNLTITVVDGTAPYSLTNFILSQSDDVSKDTTQDNKDNSRNDGNKGPNNGNGNGNGDSSNNNNGNNSGSGSKTSSSPSTATIVVAVLATSFFLLLCSLVVFLWLRRRRRLARRDSSQRTMSTLTRTESVLRGDQTSRLADSNYPFSAFGNSPPLLTRSTPQWTLMSPPLGRYKAATVPVTRTNRQSSTFSDLTRSQHAGTEPVRKKPALF